MVRSVSCIGAWGGLKVPIVHGSWARIRLKFAATVSPFSSLMPPARSRALMLMVSPLVRDAGGGPTRNESAELLQSWRARRGTAGWAGNVACDVGCSLRVLTRAGKSPRSTCAGDRTLAGSFSGAASSRASSAAGRLNPGRRPCRRFSVSDASVSTPR
jgi:hypothetical protein